MNSSIKSIPTIYNGIQFRSRLEAKWARFFDLLGWKWVYEPYDINGWIPDFILIGKYRTTLVEVKPFERLDEFEDCIKKIEKSNTNSKHNDKEILLLGTSPFLYDDFFLGWMDDKSYGWGAWYMFDEALINTGCGYGYGFYNSINCYEDRITGEYDGDHHLNRDRITIEEIFSFWKDSCNLSQWKKQETNR